MLGHQFFGSSFLYVKIPDDFCKYPFMAFLLVPGTLEVYRNKAFRKLGFCTVSMSEFKYYRHENLLLNSSLPLMLTLFSQAQALGHGLQLLCHMGLVVLWHVGSSWTTD